MRFLRPRWLLPMLVVLAAATAGGYVLLQKQRLSAGFLAEGHALAQQGRHRSALGDFTLAILLAPDERAAYIARAGAYQALRMPGEAEDDLDAAIRLSPRDASLHFQRGLLLLDTLSRYRDAVRDFDRAVALQPDRAQAWYQRGRAYDLINNPHQAVKDYTRALELDPELVEAYLRRATIYGHFRDYAGQAADLSAALRRRPGALPLYALRGQARMALRDFAGALDDFETVMSVRPSTDLHFLRGTARLNLHRYRSAIEDFSRVLRAQPYRLAAYYNRARAYSALGDKQRAHADWAAVCELEAPGQSEACYRVQQGQ